MEPSHTSVRKAVGETGDRKPLALTASPESYWGGAWDRAHPPVPAH